jgi:hypothetical protein
VTTNDRDDGLGSILLAGDLRDEGLGTDDIERGDAEKLLGVELASLLEDLGGDRNSAVDGVGDDEDEGLRGSLGDSLDQALDDAGVDLEKIVTGHTRLAYAIVGISSAA